jgi:hypothetical protein
MSSKRSLSPSSSDESSKRRRLGDVEAEDELDDVVSVEAPEVEDDQVMAAKSLMPTHHDNARVGIQRAIALVLRHDGFASATPEAMESFTSLVETCQLLWKRHHSASFIVLTRAQTLNPSYRRRKGLRLRRDAISPYPWTSRPFYGDLICPYQRSNLI